MQKCPNIGIGIGLSLRTQISEVPSGVFNYLRPDGLSLFRRPDGTSLYKRPLGS